jgi:hypothetical protein
MYNYRMNLKVLKLVPMAVISSLFSANPESNDYKSGKSQGHIDIYNQNSLDRHKEELNRLQRKDLLDTFAKNCIGLCIGLFSGMFLSIFYLYYNNKIVYMPATIDDYKQGQRNLFLLLYCMTGGGIAGFGIAGFGIAHHSYRGQHATKRTKREREIKECQSQIESIEKEIKEEEDACNKQPK